MSIFFIIRQSSYDSVILCRERLTEMNGAKDDVAVAAKYYKNLCLVSKIFLNGRTFQ